MKRPSRGAAVLTLALLLAAGCGGSGDEGEGSAPVDANGARREAGADDIAADITAAYEGVVELRGTEAAEATLELMTSRCRQELGLDALSDAELEELGDAVQDDAQRRVVDVTTRLRTATTAQVEVIVENADGTFGGALEWSETVLEDGHWRIDDCRTGARFRRIGGIDEVIPEPTAADEDQVARSIEALYLGTGTADDAWDAISARCRDVEWPGGREAFGDAFTSIGEERRSDPVDLRVTDVTFDVSSPTNAAVSLRIERDGLAMDLGDSTFEYLLEDGRWRDDDCVEPHP